MIRKTLIGSTLVLALLLAGAFGLTAMADTSSTDNGADKMKEAYQTFITTLANNLGVDEATLEAALEATQEDILAEQVANGTITQEQADKMSEKGFSFGCLGGGHGGPPPGGQDGQGGPGGPPPSDAATSTSGS